MSLEQHRRCQDCSDCISNCYWNCVLCFISLCDYH
nr:MAG TPA: 4Fe-4S dicluster domain protein [Caudoviricetes sp.]